MNQPPKDGTPFLITVDNGFPPLVAKWSGNSWFYVHYGFHLAQKIKRWAPMPTEWHEMGDEE